MLLHVLLLLLLSLLLLSLLLLLLLLSLLLLFLLFSSGEFDDGADFNLFVYTQFWPQTQCYYGLVSN